MQRILSNWSFMRFVRLVLGIAIIAQAVIARNWTMGILGALFTSMPVLNIGCCGLGGCASPLFKRNIKNTKDVTYEEVV